MKIIPKVKVILPLMAVLLMICSTPALAITEAEVEAQVSTAGKETVTGNVLIWFLCAVGFLKVSQKIDSFMASLGVNVGHTGGSMLAEAMIATRGLATVAGAAGHAIGAIGGHRSSGTAAGNAASSGTGFFKGGLVGMGARKVTNDAVRSATSSTSAVHSAKRTQAASQLRSTTEQHSSSASAVSRQSATAAESSVVSHMETGTVIQGEQVSEKTSHATTDTARTTTHHSSSTASHTAGPQSAGAFAAPHIPSLGGMLFARSIASGGSFANEVIGKVAQGDMRTTGTMSGERASEALMSYMGHTALGETAQGVPSYTDVEIGGGRITGVETAPGQAEGIAFGMYHADQYSKPQGEFSTVYSADGAKWYKQYAQDAVERKPYTAPDNTVQYNESIVKRLPDPPKRKDRL